MTLEEEKLPKQELLLKLLNMTTSDNENITCMSIRKANALLASAGWTWEKLLAGKIKVVADPFGAVAAPNPFEDDLRANRDAPSPPPRAPRAPPPPRPQSKGYARASFIHPAPPQRPPAPMPFARAALGATTQISTRPNNYSNHCYMCGDWVNSGDGFIFKPVEINPKARDAWEILCKSCNPRVDTLIHHQRAPKWANVNQPTTANL